MAVRYGLLYMGSKNKIAPKIIKQLPTADNFYDLFCGGCSITHCAILSGKWKNIIFNDIDGDVPQLFLDAINGKYKDEKRWISREDFNRLKDTDAYIKYIWSFGNNGTGYYYGKDIEPYKKAYWYALFYNDFSLFWDLGINIPKVNAKSYKEKRLKIKQEIKKLIDKKDKNSSQLNKLYKESFERLERLQSLQSLQSSECLQNLQSLQLFNTSYENIEIKPNSVIYCDIPYENTNKYISGSFDYKKFYDWACEQKELVVISSYKISDSRFQRVINFKKQSLFNVSSNILNEGLFIPKHQLELWRNLRND